MGQRIYRPYPASDRDELLTAAVTMKRRKDEWLKAAPSIHGLQPITILSDNVFRIYRFENRLTDDLVFQFWTELAEAILNRFFDIDLAVFDLYEREQRVTSGSLEAIIKANGWSYSPHEKGPVHESYVTDLWASIRTWHLWASNHHYELPLEWQTVLDAHSSIEQDVTKLSMPDSSKKAAPKLAITLDSLHRLQLPLNASQKQRYALVEEDLKGRNLKTSRRTINDAWRYYAQAMTRRI